VADLGFDLRMGRGLCQRGEGGRKSLQVLKVEVKIAFLAYTNHMSAVGRGWAPNAPPGSASIYLQLHM